MSGTVIQNQNNNQMAQNGPRNKVSVLKGILEDKSFKGQLQDTLGKNAGAFATSMIELYSGDQYLQSCEPKEVAMCAMKGATLNLPLNKNLGFAWVIPRRQKGKLMPNFEIGYKGYIQLAMRTGHYKIINTDAVYEGQVVTKNWLTGEIEIEGFPESDVAIGYFAYFKLSNGFEKVSYWEIEKIEDHAKKYSQGYNTNYSPWKTNFDKMAKKTVLSDLIRTYGIMSTEMTVAVAQDDTYKQDLNEKDEAEKEIEQNANKVDIEEIADENVVDAEIKIDDEGNSINSYGEVVAEAGDSETLFNSDNGAREPGF